MLQFRDNILQSESSKQNNRTKLLKHVCMNYYIQGRTTFQIFRAFKRKGLRGKTFPESLKNGITFSKLK